MFNFFVERSSKNSDGYVIEGKDYNHIKNVLRMKEGEKLLVSCDGKSDLCEIVSIDNESVNLRIISENFNDTELPIEITLFQGLPKSDKFELIIQKTVELGVKDIYPVEMKNCVVKLDEKKKDSKVARWQSISEAAAKQSKRNVIPKINNVTNIKKLSELINDYDLLLVPYENEDGMKATLKVLKEIKEGMKIGIVSGPEGGFDAKEIEYLTDLGAVTISLGRRILRTETAAITAVGTVMMYAELMGETM
jgi:16S rRNA (uracil1498-N3)-methyltransferase